MSKIIVKSLRPAFRRAGFEFSPEGVVLDAAKLDKEQLAAIQAERHLVVADYVEPKAEAKGK